MRGLPGERYHGAFEGAGQRQRHSARGRAGRDGARAASGVDQSHKAFDQPGLDALQLAFDGVTASTELDAQRHRDARDVAPAEDRVAPRHRQQRVDRV